MTRTVEEAGWAWPGASRKAHYFSTSGRSLCGRWAYFGEKDENQKHGTAPQSGDCIACWRKVTLAELEASAGKKANQ